MRRIGKLLIGVLVLMAPMLSHAQSARALFGNSSGVTFNTQSKDVEQRQPQAPQAQRDSKEPSPASSAPAYSGLSYKILQEYPEGELRLVSPNKVFRTGDRIKVVLTSNKSGELSVNNIDPAGKLSNIAEQSMATGVPVNVPANGFLKFVGAKGTEQLIFVLSKVSLSKQAKEMGNPMTTIISSCFQNKATRSLVVDDSAGNEVGVVNANGNCASPSAGKTRSLVVEVANNAGYAVIPDSALAEGQMLTLKINLRHQ